ncbi:MAG: metallopeptidase family protein [Paracoccaceae bacterium]
MALNGADPGHAPSLEDVERLAVAAFEDLPDEVRSACGPLIISVEEFAPDDVLDELGLEDPYELTGLYEGVALTDKSHDDVAPAPDVVRLFRRAILEEWVDRGDVALERLVAHVLVHEIAHHFGWSDEAIAEIDPWWE